MTFGPFELPAAADFHVHLRDGPLSAVVTPTIRAGGVNQVYVMPNLVPPVTTVPAALAYKSRLQAIDSSIDYLMTLYLHPDITPSVVREAKAAGISGIKSYPSGVTTNSDAGVVSYEPFYPVFAAMEEEGLVLNLHGECPNDEKEGIDVMNAESKFLPTLKDLHRRFPRLRIVLEHCTTAEAVAAVKECGDTVAGTITSHHLFITSDDWKRDPHCFCKPVAKNPTDRKALIQAVMSSKGKFFMGTDSAPHPVASKTANPPAAGAFTQPYASQLVLQALEDAVARGEIDAVDVTQEIVEGYLSGYGRKFYGVAAPAGGERIRLSKKDEVVREKVSGEELEVVVFRAGEKIWSVEWI